MTAERHLPLDWGPVEEEASRAVGRVLGRIKAVDTDGRAITGLARVGLINVLALAAPAREAEVWKAVRLGTLADLSQHQPILREVQETLLARILSGEDG